MPDKDACLRTTRLAPMLAAGTLAAIASAQPVRALALPPPPPQQGEIGGDTDGYANEALAVVFDDWMGLRIREALDQAKREEPDYREGEPPFVSEAPAVSYETFDPWYGLRAQARFLRGCANGRQMCETRLVVFRIHADLPFYRAPNSAFLDWHTAHFDPAEVARALRRAGVPPSAVPYVDAGKLDLRTLPDPATTVLNQWTSRTVYSAATCPALRDGAARLASVRFEAAGAVPRPASRQEPAPFAGFGPAPQVRMTGRVGRSAATLTFDQSEADMAQTASVRSVVEAVESTCRGVARTVGRQPAP